MLQAFFIVLREGVEAFLMVAITAAYLRKTCQGHLIPALVAGIVGSIVVSGLLGYFLWITEGQHQPVIEGAFGLITAVLVATLVVHMMKVGPTMKQEMESQLSKASAAPTLKGSLWGVFLFTLLMISREGMETALLLLQVQDAQIVTGVLLGVAAAGLVAYLWQQFGYLINLKHFFQVTAVYLLLFTVQIAVQSFHEFAEGGVLPNSEVLHAATEPFSSDGIYGKWYLILTVTGCGLWLCLNLISERFPFPRKQASRA
ncbi:MAG TPA: FTR1 family protein [Verrucomicrobiae bacterium]|jgi:high-affinity iron transporter|nr:FTR1 family protein [Verrucomicrobiae bacterium]